VVVAVVMEARMELTAAVAAVVVCLSVALLFLQVRVPLGKEQAALPELRQSI
jgi:hypothetical protein